MSTPESEPELLELSHTHPILFFDGVCGLCSHSVDFVMLRDRDQNFRFTPLQGAAAQQVLTEADRNNLGSMVLLWKGNRYRKSAAVVRVLWQLPQPWRFLGSLMWLIPLPLRNLGYTLVAGSRYQLFGKKESCRLPTPAERSRFLN